MCCRVTGDESRTSSISYHKVPQSENFNLTKAAYDWFLSSWQEIFPHSDICHFEIIILGKTREGLGSRRLSCVIRELRHNGKISSKTPYNLYELCKFKNCRFSFLDKHFCRRLCELFFTLNGWWISLLKKSQSSTLKNASNILPRLPHNGTYDCSKA